MDHHVKPAFAGLSSLALAIAVIGSAGFAATAHAQTTGTASNGSNGSNGSSPAEIAFWQSVSETRDRNQYEAYLAAFPQGLFAGLARAKIAGLPGAAAKPESAEPTTTALPAAAVIARESPAPALAPALAPAPASSPVRAPTLTLSLVEQLRTLAMSQGNRYSRVSIVIPPRPALSEVSQLEVPPQFCSAVQRNAFHDERFRPAIEKASRNNTDAIAYMTTLTKLASEALAKGDNNTSGALVTESHRYEAVAQNAFLERTALASAYSRIMAAPVIPCAGASH